MAHAHHHSQGFDPHRLLDREPNRRRLIDPERIMKEALQAGDRQMADVGCGVGFYALAAAPLISPGTVRAVDVHPDMVRTTLERARESGMDNVQGVVCDAMQLPLETGSIDLVFMGTVLHDFAKPVQALAEARRVLGPNGRLYLVEWSKTAIEDGPPDEVRFSEEALQQLLLAAHFQPEWVKSGPGPFYRVLAWLTDGE